MTILDDKDEFEPTITAEAVRANIQEWQEGPQSQYTGSVIKALQNLEQLILRTTRGGQDA